MPKNETKVATKRSIPKPPPRAKGKGGALPVAALTLTVEDGAFRDVLKSGGEPTVARMGMQRNSGPAVGRKKLGGVRIDDQVLHIKHPGARIKLMVKSRAKDEDLIPLGIAFWRLRGSREDRAALMNFIDIRRDGDCLFVTDTYTDEGKPDRYKFSVVIQRLSDGALGLIDPPIEHEP